MACLAEKERSICGHAYQLVRALHIVRRDQTWTMAGNRQIHSLWLEQDAKMTTLW